MYREDDISRTENLELEGDLWGSAEMLRAEVENVCETSSLHLSQTCTALPRFILLHKEDLRDMQAIKLPPSYDLFLSLFLFLITLLSHTFLVFDNNHES